jgi:hypothetical protein
MRWPWLLLAAAILLIHQPLVALAWQRIVRALGGPLRVAEAVQIYLMAQIARYLPGGIWDVAGRVYLAGERGHSRAKISYSIVVEMVLHVVSAALFFLATLVFWQDVRAIWPMVVAFAGIAVLGLLTVYPPVMTVALAWLARLSGRVVGSGEAIPLAGLVRLLGWQFLARLLVGSAFAAFAIGVYPVSSDEFGRLAGVFVAGWLVGYLVVIMPMGLGVREGAIAWLLTRIMPLPAATAIAIGFRLLIALRDLTLAGVGARLRGGAG